MTRSMRGLRTAASGSPQSSCTCACSALFYSSIAHAPLADWSDSHHVHAADRSSTSNEVDGRPTVLPACDRTTPEQGGETVFPKAQNKVTGPEWSDCAKEVCPRDGMVCEHQTQLRAHAAT